MDQSNKNNSQLNRDRKLTELTDFKLIDCAEIIFNELKKKHNNLNDKKLRRLINKNALICQNTDQFEEMFKGEIFKELDGHYDDYRKLEAYQDISTKLDNELINVFNDIKLMEFNIGESRFVESFRNLSENIKLTKNFLEDSKDKIDCIYERIKNLN